MILAKVCRTAAFALSALLAAAPSDRASAATWSVSTSGDDANPGSADRPFVTWQRAIEMAVPGDTILIEPGIYRLAGSRSFGVRISHNGTSSAPIALRGNGGRAVLDCSGLAKRGGVSCLQVEGSWWRISDIEVTGALQTSPRAWSIGVLLANASDNTLERVASYHNEGPGISVTGNSLRNLLVDCEASFNYDRWSDPPGGNADGVQLVELPETAGGNRVARCRSFENSDDGVDLWHAEAPVLIQDSVAFRNGFVPGTQTPAGDGSGFKLGSNRLGPAHRLERNVAYGNRHRGFDRNGARGSLTLIENRAFHNGSR